LILQQGEYKGTFFTTVHGNCKGAAIIESAISNIMDDLIDEDDNGSFIKLYLKDDKGEICDFELWDDGAGMDMEEDFKNMVVGARIIDIQKEEG
jgi:hypothetical protein